MLSPANQRMLWQYNHNGRSEYILGIVTCTPAFGYQTTGTNFPRISCQEKETVSLKPGAGQRTNSFHTVLTTHPTALQDRLELRQLVMGRIVP